MLAPIVVISTVVVIASGVALLLAGPSSRGTLLPIHKASFIIWIAATALHVLGHLPAMRKVLRADFSHSAQFSSHVTGRAGRVLALSSAVVGGAVLAVLVIPDFGPWLHATGVFDHHH